jgi:ArsR family transcriptional regulator
MAKKKQELTPQALDMIAMRFRVLSEPMRLRILHTLGDAEMTVGDLVAAVETSQANMSKHLGILLDAGLVAKRKEGLNAFYRVADESIFNLCEVVCESLAERLEAQRGAVESFAKR